MKAIRAALGGSALAALISTAGLTVFNALLYGSQTFQFLPSMLGVLVLSFLFATAVACTLGLLWHRLAVARGWRTIHAYWPPAIIVGILPVFILMVLPSTNDTALAPPINASWIRTFATLLTLGASLGGLTAVFAWLIRRPDRDAPNPPTSPP